MLRHNCANFHVFSLNFQLLVIKNDAGKTKLPSLLNFARAQVFEAPGPAASPDRAQPQHMMVCGGPSTTRWYAGTPSTTSRLTRAKCGPTWTTAPASDQGPQVVQPRAMMPHDNWGVTVRMVVIANAREDDTLSFSYNLPISGSDRIRICIIFAAPAGSWLGTIFLSGSCPASI